jgi:hypothetical protein
VAEDDVDGLGRGAEGEDAHLGAAAGAEQREGLVDAGGEAPAGAGGDPLRRVRWVGAPPSEMPNESNCSRPAVSTTCFEILYPRPSNDRSSTSRSDSPLPRFVVADQRVIAAQLGQPVVPDGAGPSELEMAQPVGSLYERCALPRDATAIRTSSAALENRICWPPCGMLN